MKTAEELWDKWQLLIPEEEVDDMGITTGRKLTKDQRITDCIFYDDFFKALTEYRESIIKMIDEKIEEIDDGYIDKYHSWEVSDILTEIKNKIERQK